MEKLYDFKSGLSPKDEMVIEIINKLNERIDIYEKSMKENLNEGDYKFISILSASIESYKFIKWFIERNYKN